MLVVHMGTTVHAHFALVDDQGNIIQRKEATVQLDSTVDPQPWATLREQVASLRAQIQAQAQPVPATSPAAPEPAPVQTAAPEPQEQS